MIRSRFAIVLVSLAMVSLLGVPALANCSQGCGMGIGEHGQIGSIDGLHGAWDLLVDKATRDNFQNMTLAEIEALKQKKMQELDNMTLAKIEALKQEKMRERENMTLSELNAKMPLGNFGRWQDEMRPCEGKGNFDPTMRNNNPKGMGVHLGWLLDDVSKDKLNNMTLFEIRNLRAQNMKKLQNMTLAEISALKQKKMQEQANITLSELRDQGAYWTEMSGPMMGFGSMGPDRQNEHTQPGFGPKR